MKEILTHKDVADLFGVTRRTIRRWWYAGDLPSPFYQGRTPFWTADAIRTHMRDAQAHTNRT